MPADEQRNLADLHRHLDGSLREETLQRWAQADGVTPPDPVRFYPRMGLDAALRCFALTVGLLRTPERLAQVAAEVCEDAAAEGVAALEVRFAPQIHAAAASGARASIERYVDAALEGIAKRAGLILCGLYGEAPEVLQTLVEVAAPRPGVVGIDLAGGPTGGHRWTMADYVEPFAAAARVGLGRTVHAGEGRPAAEIAMAIELLGAQRIGHGLTLLEDDGVLELVLRRQVTIEACPTSNVHTGIIASVAAHPLVRWMERGVRVCLCTDNTFFSDTDARRELERVKAIPGFTTKHRQALHAMGRTSTFER